MNQRNNRTLVCSVLYLDIVGYSTSPVIEQLRLKQCLNDALRGALRGLPELDRIVLEMSSGTVISFLGRPELALFVALDLRQSLATSGASASTPAALRIGINLGPVRVTGGPDEPLNIVGDGINVAERIAGFAEPDGVLVSRSYFEVVSRVSPEFQRVFRFDGTRTDRQVRDHAVYVVEISEATALQANEVARLAARTAAPVGVAEVPDGADLPGGSAEPMRVPVADPVRRGVLVGALVVAMLMIGVATAVRIGSPPAARVVTDRLAMLQPVPEPAEAPTSPRALPPSVASDPPALAAPGDPAAPVADPVVRSLKTPSAVVKPAEQPVASPAEDVVVTLVVAPWGEVYLDGRLLGVSPPLKRLSVSPGRHEIEIRNTTFPTYRHHFEAKSGLPIRIEHRY